MSITVSETFESVFFTQQVFLIGTTDEDGSPRFAPFSWISYTGGKPACLVLSMDGDKRTKRNIVRNGMLSATVLTPDLLPYAESHSSYTPYEGEDELPAPTVINGSVLDVPLISGAKWSYECSLLKTVEIGEAHTYFAEIKSVHIDDDVAALDFIDLRAINPVLWSPGHYFTIGECIGRIGDFSI